MKVKGIERVALQVKNLDDAIALFSELLGTSFQRHDVQIGDSSLRLAFSELGIELLQEVPPSDHETLRSFHLRVEDIKEVHAAIAAAGGEVLAEFSVGEMAHIVTRVGVFRILFVEYPGNDALSALAGSAESQSAASRGSERDTTLEGGRSETSAVQVRGR
jgi:predicted enzyme related to lactoylglutathione lyase